MLRNIFLILFLLVISVSAHADGIVFDPTNFAKNAITAEKTAAAVDEQIKQYRKQVLQYKDQLQNTKSLTQQQYIWDQVNETINNLINLTDTIDYYKQQAGSLQQYLARYQDVQIYQNSPCFSSTGCTDAERQQLMTAMAQASEAQKKANDAMMTGLDQQQQNLKADSENLANLQAQATSATGRMQALEAANQLASAQANQLFQIRALLVAQQTAEATRAEVVADREAQQEASLQQLLKGSFHKSDNIGW